MSDEPQRLINTYDQLLTAVAAKLLPKKHAVAISSAAHASRGSGGGTHAWSPFFYTEPSKENCLYNHKRKAFFGHGAGERKAAVELAKVWVRETYGYVGEWKRNAMFDWVPAIVQEKFPIKRRPK